MQRRDFISLLGGASAAWPLAARAQQPAMPVVGLLSPRSPAVDASLISVIRQGLSDTGFVEGQNVALDYRRADGQYDRLTALAADLVHRKVAISVALGGEISAVAAKTATATIPIVFLAGSDPVRSGLVSRLNRPGGNITGVSSFIFDLEPKRLGLMRELRPNATTIAILVNPNSPNAEIRVNDIQIAARNVGQQVDILNASTIREIDAAFARLAQMRVDALLVAADPVFFNRASQLVVLATRHAIPALYSRREFVAAGGLMSYGSNADKGYRTAGVYAGRILKGEKPGRSTSTCRPPCSRAPTR
jgi:putative ABC transport system substrate-binding protein